MWNPDRPTERASFLLRYSLAVLPVLAVVLLKELLVPMMGRERPFLLFGQHRDTSGFRSHHRPSSV